MKNANIAKFTITRSFYNRIRSGLRNLKANYLYFAYQCLYQDFFFFPHMLIFLRKCISNHENKQASKFQIDRSPNCFTINIYLILLLYHILQHFPKFCSVLRCDILGIGLFEVQYLFKTIIYSSVKMKKSHNIPLR